MNILLFEYSPVESFRPLPIAPICRALWPFENKPLEINNSQISVLKVSARCQTSCQLRTYRPSAVENGWLGYKPVKILHTETVSGTNFPYKIKKERIDEIFSLYNVEIFPYKL